jgi:rSAM/selenodomain-associated transferase 1
MTRKNRTAYILFTRNPVIGKVKTRLAAEVGEEEALRIYLLMLHHSLKVVDYFPSQDVKIYIDEYPEDRNYLGKYKDHLFLQRGVDLGQKMEFAIEEQLLEYDQALLFGTDILELDKDVFALAKDQLKRRDAVLGPSKDGGYYLIGLKRSLPIIFKEIPWSSDQVAKNTIRRIINTNLSLFLTPVLGDVDYKADWEKYRNLVE